MPRVVDHGALVAIEPLREFDVNLPHFVRREFKCEQSIAQPKNRIVLGDVYSLPTNRCVAGCFDLSPLRIFDKRPGEDIDSGCIAFELNQAVPFRVVQQRLIFVVVLDLFGWPRKLVIDRSPCHAARFLIHLALIEPVVGRGIHAPAVSPPARGAMDS